MHQWIHTHTGDGQFTSLGDTKQRDDKAGNMHAWIDGTEPTINNRRYVHITALRLEDSLRAIMINMV